MPVDLSAVATLDLPDISNMPRHEHTIQESVEEGEEESQMVGSLTGIYINSHNYYLESSIQHSVHLDITVIHKTTCTTSL